MLKAYVGGRLFGARYGVEPATVVALHGWQRSHVDFESVLAPPLADGRVFNALALDLPGFGASPPPTAPWGSSEYAAALQPLLGEIGDPVVLLAHSFGGRVALQLAAREPTRVRALVLCGVPQLVRTKVRARIDPRYKLVRSLARAHLLSPSRLEAARARFGSADYRAATGIMREVLVRLLQEHYEEQLAQIKVPVELVWGELDTAAPLGLATEAAALLSKGHLSVLPGVGHLVPTEAPNALRAALERLGC